MAKPDLRGVRCEIGNLRDFIEDKENDPLERRLAQVAEDALRWATEDTDWAGPIEDVSGMANIIRHERLYTTSGQLETMPHDGMSASIEAQIEGGGHPRTD